MPDLELHVLTAAVFDFVILLILQPKAARITLNFINLPWAKFTVLIAAKEDQGYILIEEGKGTF